MPRVTKGTSSHNQRTRSDKRLTQKKAQPLYKSYKFDAKSVSSWQPVSQSLVNATLQVIEENIRKTKDVIPRHHHKKVDQALAQFYLRATERLKRLKAPKGKRNLRMNNLDEKVEAAKSSLAEVNETLEHWSQSCDEVKVKAAELRELCQSKSFNSQPLIPRIAVRDDPQCVEQQLQESHLAYHNRLPSYTVTI